MSITTPSGLQYDDTVTGSGPVASSGQRVTVHYTGWLFQDGAQGAKFDSSKDRNDPFVFSLGAGMVIRGWDEGVAGMRVGGARTLIIPVAHTIFWEAGPAVRASMGIADGMIRLSVGLEDPQDLLADFEQALGT